VTLVWKSDCNHFRPRDDARFSFLIAERNVTARFDLYFDCCNKNEMHAMIGLLSFTTDEATTVKSLVVNGRGRGGGRDLLVHY